jgi:predicted AlkP superfamily pyrophosphatase or phosphodiesterase
MNQHIRTTSFILCILIVLLLQADAQTAAQDMKPTVILISIDGFRHDYLDRINAPALRAVAAEGTRADALIPQFPTLTFPNHYAIATGLLPAHNGIVGNVMYDENLATKFTMHDHSQVIDGRWWGGEPIWVTAEKQGQKSATMFWPGSEAKIEGVRPSYCVPYDQAMPGARRVEQVLEWIDLPADQRPTLLTLYFEGVDTAGHEYGPKSKQVRRAVLDVDASIRQLLSGLKQRSLLEKVNVVIVSDHGMAETSCKRVIDLQSMIDKGVRVGESGAILTLYGDNKDMETMFEKLQGIAHLTVYRDSETPLRWAYSGNPRIGKIIAVADEGWTIRTSAPSTQPKSCTGGKHGYDNQLPDLQGVFLARGPAFRTGGRIPAFDNIDIYDLVAHLLNLHPAPNDGTLAPFAQALRVEGVQAN